MTPKNNIYFLILLSHFFSLHSTTVHSGFFFWLEFIFAAKPAPLRNCTLRPYSLPTSSILPSKVVVNSTSHRLRSPPLHPPLSHHDDDDDGEGNQILNEGQPLKELSYLTDYVKEKNFHREDQRKSLSLGKSPSNIFHHPQQQTTEALSSEDEKNLSLNFLHSRQNEKFYHVERPNKNNNSDSIIFYDNKSHSAQRLSDVKRSLRRRMSQLGTVDEPSALATTINNTKMIDSPKSARMHNNNQINNFSAALHEQQQKQHLSSMPLRSRKNNRTSAASKSHQSPTGNSYAATGSAFEIVPSDAVGGGGGSNSGAVGDQQPTLMELECIAGYDGGLPQYFFLEAYDSQSRKLRLNITSALNDVPLFRIDLASESQKKYY